MCVCVCVWERERETEIVCGEKNHNLFLVLFCVLLIDIDILHEKSVNVSYWFIVIIYLSCEYIDHHMLAIR